MSKNPPEMSPVINVLDAGPISAAPNPQSQPSLTPPARPSTGELLLGVEVAALKGEAQKTAAETARMQSELNNVIDKLKRDNADLQKNIINRDNERNVLIQKLAAAQISSKQRDTETETAAAVSSNLASARLQIDLLNSQIQKLTDDNKRFAEQLQQTRQGAGMANEQITTTQKELSAARLDLISARQGTFALTEQIKTLTSENQRLTAQKNEESAKAANANDTAAHSLTATQKELADARAEATGLRNDLATLSAHLQNAGAVSRVLSETQTEVKTLNVQLADSSTRLAAITGERDAALIARDASERRLKTIESALADLTRERDAQTQRIASLEQQQTSAGASTTRLVAITSERDAALIARDVSDKRLKTIESALAELTKERDAQTQRIALLEQQQTSAGASMTRLVAITGERDAALIARDASDKRLKTIESALADLTKERDAQTQRIASLEQQQTNIADNSTSTDELRKQLADSDGKLSIVLRSFQIKQNEVDEIRKQLITAEGHIANLSAQLNASSAQLNEAGRRSENTEKLVQQLTIARENLRQMQLQSAQVAEENLRLRTLNAFGAPQQPQMAAQTTTHGQPQSAPMPTTAPQSRPTQPSNVVPATYVNTPQPVPVTHDAPETRMHTVVPGDSLSGIARKYYGSSEYWTEIYEANRDQLKNSESLKLGMKLRIP